MARSSGIEERMNELRQLDVSSEKAIGELRKALRSEKGLLISVAAKRAGEERVRELVEDLAAAFAPLCEDGAKRDPGCRGKLAIAKALQELDEWDDRVFVAGLSVVQLEGFDREDTAAALRGSCGLAHVQFAKANALDVLAGLLADSHRNARYAAAQGIGYSGRIDTTALLRYVLLAGHEDDPNVIAACFEALFSLTPDSAAEFAIERLAAHDAVAEAAALALGSHRIASAVEPLATWCEGARPEQRHRVGYVSLALLRNDAANAKLVEAIAERGKADRLAAAKALATFKDDAAIAKLLRDAIADLDSATRKEIEAMLR